MPMSTLRHVGSAAGLALLGLLATSALSSPVVVHAQEWTPAAAGRIGYSTTPVWADEFNGAFDPITWHQENRPWWDNGELQYYSNDPKYSNNVNGELQITATADKNGGRDYTSARLSTKNSMLFKQGLYAARIKMTKGQGIWPAFWMFGTGAKYSEFDIAELVGGNSGLTKPPTGSGDDASYGSLCHFAVEDGGPVTPGPGCAHHAPKGQIFADDYHVMWMEWNEKEVWAGLDTDDQQMFVADVSQLAAFQAHMYIILNIAVGGHFPGNPDSTTEFPQTMHVDWVRVYARPGQNVLKNLNPPISQWTPANAGRVGYGTTPVWSDEFNAALDTTRWTAENVAWPYGNELQYYSNNAKYAATSNGELVITATDDPLGPKPYTSARLTTKKSMTFKHGLFAAKMKLPRALGLRALFELFGIGDLYSEMQIASYIGDTSASTPVVSRLYFTSAMGDQISTGPGSGHQAPGSATAQFDTDYHVYWMEWTGTEVWAGVDNLDQQRVIEDITQLPAFENYMYLVLNIAVGGDAAGPVDPKTVFPEAMHVDWVRVFAQNGESITAVPPPSPEGPNTFTDPITGDVYDTKTGQLISSGNLSTPGVDPVSQGGLNITLTDDNGELTSFVPPPYDSNAWQPLTAGRIGYDANPVWSDEFTGDIDTTKWTREDQAWPYGNEGQYYSPDPKYSSNANGVLTISGTADSTGDRSFTSARLTTKDHMAFTHGLFAARMKLPVEQGVRALFELFGIGELYSELVVASLNGDGTAKTSAVSRLYFTSAVGDQIGTGPGCGHLPPTGEQFSADYHVFWVEWTGKEVWAGVDQKDRQRVVADITKLPSFAQPMYLVMDVSIGGDYTGAPTSATKLPARMNVDWVRVFKKTADPSILMPLTPGMINPDGTLAGAATVTCGVSLFVAIVSTIYAMMQ